MKTYKLSLIAALALGGLMACASLATAQDNKDSKGGSGQGQGRGRMSVDARMERLTTELSLTDAQKPKVKAVLEETQKKAQGLRDLPQDERREKMTAIREDESKALKPILTPEQMEKYKNLPQQFRRGQGGEKKEGEKKAN
jgi:hypothetical protein